MCMLANTSAGARKTFFFLTITFWACGNFWEHVRHLFSNRLLNSDLLQLIETSRLSASLWTRLASLWPRRLTRWACGFVIIIIDTRTKPAYGRQGLAESWGQDTNQARIFWGILNVSLRTSGAQFGCKLTLNHKKPTWNHEKP